MNDPLVVGSLIGGSSPATSSAALAIPVICPWTEEEVGRLIEADASEVDAAIVAARQAFDSGPWPQLGIDERKDILYAISDCLGKHREELAQLEVLNTGIPLTQVHGHVRRAMKNFEFFAEVASTVRGETYTGAKGFLTYVTRQPKGVAALIAPWNAPLALASMRVATCIAFGNTCVLKPSEYTPLSIRRMVEIFHEAGLPPGVVNLVNGRGSVTGAALIAHPGVDMVGFTGGTRTGAAIMAEAGRRLKPGIMELGGKSANIVHESADLERALDGSLAAIYGNNGQQCLAGARILVQRSIATEFIERFVARAKAIRLGPPLDTGVEMGPLTYQAHMNHVLSFVPVAIREGGTLLTGGRRAPGFERGYFVEPTAVLVQSNADTVSREEIFGPFVTIQLYDTLTDAIRIANESEFGLVSYLWARDLDAVMRVSRDIRAGTLWVNTTVMRELRAPFGGFKQSGIGRDGALSSTEFFTDLKTTTIAIDATPLPSFGRLEDRDAI
jgi:acyl-CoA reductase-like NAD-dependent aldehyde dehydrogenase